jgi:signal transduction histidine kinase
MAAAIALGDSIRARRALSAEQEHTARLIRQEYAYRAEQRVQAERVQMARDLHDLLGHSITVIAIQADVAVGSGRTVLIFRSSARRTRVGR